ncbi:MAG: NAD-dependent dehydratase [Desulfuromonas sp.]|nr:MAG: NAD-dependent dehydratase [Desulfuromonas sp.]
MRVFVTGGTGFVGSCLIRHLVEAGNEVVALCRAGSETKLPASENVEGVAADLFDANEIAGRLDGCDAVIHLVGIIREFPGKGVTFQRLHVEATRAVVAAAQQAGVKRYLQMSANGTRPGATTPYHRTKWEAEEILRGSSLDWTIFRPSLIFGPGDQFVTMLADLIRKLPVVPVIGDGNYRMSPVLVDDVVRSFVSALQRPETVGETYHCGGPQALSYNEVLDLIGRAMGRERVPKLHHPLLLMKPVVAMLESIPQFPLTRTQLTMLLEGNEVDPAPWAAAFDLDPQPFLPAIENYLS